MPRRPPGDPCAARRPLIGRLRHRAVTRRHAVDGSTTRPWTAAARGAGTRELCPASAPSWSAGGRFSRRRWHGRAIVYAGLTGCWPGARAAVWVRRSSPGCRIRSSQHLARQPHPRRAVLLSVYLLQRLNVSIAPRSDIARFVAAGLLCCSRLCLFVDRRLRRRGAATSWSACSSLLVDVCLLRRARSHRGVAHRRFGRQRRQPGALAGGPSG